MTKLYFLYVHMRPLTVVSKMILKTCVKITHKINKTREDFSLKMWPWPIGFKSLRKMLKPRLVVHYIKAVLSTFPTLVSNLSLKP